MLRRRLRVEGSLAELSGKLIEGSTKRPRLRGRACCHCRRPGHGGVAIRGHAAQGSRVGRRRRHLLWQGLRRGPLAARHPRRGGARVGGRVIRADPSGSSSGVAGAPGQAKYGRLGSHAGRSSS